MPTAQKSKSGKSVKSAPVKKVEKPSKVVKATKSPKVAPRPAPVVVVAKAKKSAPVKVVPAPVIEVKTKATKSKEVNTKVVKTKGKQPPIKYVPSSKTVHYTAPVAPAPAVKLDPFGKAVEFLTQSTDYERMRVVRYNTTTFSLDRMRKLLKHLDDPHTKFKSVHVAGTKGKGSVCHMLAAMLQGGGLKVGLYTSPHVTDIRERIILNGAMITPDEFTEQAKKVEAIYKKMADDRPTFFELMTAMAFDYFAQQHVDIAVIEVGLGGRLDSTNVITPEVSAITSISKDHMAILGPTLVKIAEEKAGIIKKEIPVVTIAQTPEVEQVFQKVAAANKTTLNIVGRDLEFSYRFEAGRLHAPMIRVSLLTEHSKFEHIPVPLFGEHQALNLGLVMAVVDKLKQRGFVIDEVKACEALSRVYIPGRMEMVNQDPRVLVDGAHNASSLQALFRAVGQHIPYDSMVVIFGCNCDKDIDGMLEQLQLGADKVIFTRSKDNPKSAMPDEMANLYIERYGKMAQVATTLTEALSIARRAISREDLITVTGSFYLVGDVKEHFRKRVGLAAWQPN
jgi:dihydrofolate synthase/folylpolyglutamate synthase